MKEERMKSRGKKKLKEKWVNNSIFRRLKQEVFLHWMWHSTESRNINKNRIKCIFNCKRNIENGWKMNDTKIYLICKSIWYYAGNKNRSTLWHRRCWHEGLLFSISSEQRNLRNRRVGGPWNEKRINIKSTVNLY